MKSQKKFKRRPAGKVHSNELSDLTKNTSASNLPEFYLVHITHAGAASQILRNDPPWLEATPCRVFDNKARLYFFVMRPLFRLREGDVEQTLVSHFPVAFVMEAKLLDPPIQVAAFDTGAAAAGKYDDYYSPGAYLDDYLLEPQLDAVKRFMSWGYGSAEAYYEGRLRDGLVQTIPNFMSIAHSWLQIARTSAPGTHNDLRGSAIEIAYDKGFPLEGKVKLCIVPDELLQDSDLGAHSKILNILVDKKIKYETYHWSRGSRPNDHLIKINNILRKYLSDAGLL